MEELRRYMIIIIGNSTGIEKDLNEIADSDNGVDFVDSKVLFLGTFYSPFSTTDIHEKLSNRPAMLLFDITEPTTYGVNLPSKYYNGLFPESREISDMINEVTNKEVEEKPKRRKRKDGVKPQPVVEEYTNMNDILDKLSRNNYDRGCLTKNELKILDSMS